jgi:hypothetical protein
MTTAVGIFVIIVGTICWAGQSLSFFFPNIAVKLGVLEPKEEMDDTFYIIDSKVLGANDMALTWILPVSAVMMLFDSTYWPVFALIGSGIFVYFSGYIILSRLVLRSAGKKVGSNSSQVSGHVFGLLWIIASIGMSVLSIIKLYQT